MAANLVRDEVRGVEIRNQQRELLEYFGDRDHLRDADLTGADLRGADLELADLRGANLRGANLAEIGRAHV